MLQYVVALYYLYIYMYVLYIATTVTVAATVAVSFSLPQTTAKFIASPHKDV